MLPSEELFRIDRGADYGWPYCFHDPAQGKVLTPEYGGDGEIEGRCARVREPRAVNVVFVPFDESGPAGDYEVFADGFAGDGQPLPDAALHRPVGWPRDPTARSTSPTTRAAASGA